MKKIVAATVLALSPIAGAAPPPPRPTHSIVKPTPTPKPRTCRDPAAVYLMSRVVVQQPGGGQIEIVGQIVNRGNGAFVSPPMQAHVKIVESRPQGGAPIVRADQPLANLPPGNGVVLRFQRPWTRNVQFPPTFSLVITYDPDILHDSNPENDDCDQSNNQIDLAGAVIDHEWPNQVMGRPRH
jgi:hypothetical protein